MLEVISSAGKQTVEFIFSTYHCKLARRRKTLWLRSPSNFGFDFMHKYEKNKNFWPCYLRVAKKVFLQAETTGEIFQTTLWSSLKVVHNKMSRWYQMNLIVFPYNTVFSVQICYRAGLYQYLIFFSTIYKQITFFSIIFFFFCL